MQVAKKYTDSLLYLAIATTGFFCIFQLPFLFAGNVPVVSDSYLFGFNNRVTVLSTLAIGGVLYLVRKYSEPINWFVLPTFEGKSVKSEVMSKGLFTGVAIIYVLATIAMYFFIPDLYFGESGYLLRRVELVHSLGLRPYRDFEFCYGPAMLYPLAVFAGTLGQLGVSLRASYFLFFILVNLICLGMLFGVIDRADIGKNNKSLIFVLIALSVFPVLSLALNGWVRHLTPYASLIAVYALSRDFSCTSQISTAQIGKLFAIGAVLSLLNLAISPEVGIAFTVAFALYLGWLGFTVNRRFLVNLLVHIVTLPIFLFFISPDYLQSIFNFLGGGYNFPVVPAPHILLYLLAFFVLIPAQLVALTEKERPDRALVVGLLVLNVIMLPGALGRCDFWHVVLYGIGVFTLTLLGLAKAAEHGQLPRLAHRASLAAFVLVFVVAIRALDVYVYRYQFINYAIEDAYRLLGEEKLLGIASTLKLGRSKLEAKIAQVHSKEADYAALRALERYPKLLSPVQTTDMLERYLKVSGKNIPEFFVDNQGVYTEKQIARKLMDVGAATYVLVPVGSGATVSLEEEERKRQQFLSHLLLFPFSYPRQRDTYELNSQLLAYLTKNFHKVDQVAGYDVLERRSAQAL